MSPMLMWLAAGTTAILLILAGVTELSNVAKWRRDILWSRRLCAIGFFALGARLLALVESWDIDRLHILSLTAISSIATGRIIANIQVLRGVVKLSFNEKEKRDDG